MLSRVLADVVDPHQFDDPPDRKRMQEAIRYTLEALALLKAVESGDPPTCAFLHGPLVNQFVTYDEEQPYFIPDVLPELLAEFGLTEEVVTSAIRDIPRRPDDNSVRWNGFMAVYAVIIRRILDASAPCVGVVERGVGRQVASSILTTLQDRGIVSDAVARRVQGLLKHYGISDDLLFGCVLKQGEYTSPVTLKKNPPNRAHDRWQLVVRQYGNPRATMIKPHDGAFPLRLELNNLATERIDEIASVAYHTARLLPQYAFPVGLDIVDKYAKVPDWMARAVGHTTAAALLRHAVEHNDDPQFLAAVRRQVAGQPRDFFFRPTVV
jgi:hypothetical protein